jgi:hypothetical protein
MSITKLYLSGGSADGRPIKVAATATPGTIIHTSAGMDELWLWAVNTDTTARKLTLEWGGVTAPDDLLEWNAMYPEGGLVPLVQGNILASGLIVRAFAATANVVTVVGFVHRIV